MKPARIKIAHGSKITYILGVGLLPFQRFSDIIQWRTGSLSCNLYVPDLWVVRVGDLLRCMVGISANPFHIRLTRADHTFPDADSRQRSCILARDRKSTVCGKSVTRRLEYVGRRTVKKKN